ncbi:hypothetical protein PVAND_009626 [Polypedilum vanderplanki]|uniref:C-type lectin domain-containing protein n=1 Tax=Polypedilum vanderplanki TaxID=319348 RepID=A0A9J6CDC0_POLVA|nr:hypothetical protein PVAND_009626 [Polypedilum vanderplanki]
MPKVSIMIFKILLVTISISYVSAIYVQNELKNLTKRVDLSPAVWTEPEDGIWSSLLEDYTINNKEKASRTRESRDFMQTVQAPNFFGPSNAPQFPQPQTPFSYHKYIPTSEAYLTRRAGEEDEVITGKVISPSSQQMLLTQQQLPLKLQSQNRQYQFNSPREVSETDLYLLGAIEKLVYRVDYMEKRLKRTEQLIYYLMAGNNQKIESDECPKNFTKVGKDCYHFGIKERTDWKTAALKCKSLGGSMAEFDKIEKFQDVVAYVLSHQDLRGQDFWLGGLNPGLLWIWSTSAKPVNNNANLTAITSSKTESVTKIPLKVVNNHIQNKTDTSSKFPEIKGDGRCLRLSYNPTLFNYGYSGQDCATKQHFMCVILDKSLDNEINRIAKELKLDLN